MTICPNCGQHNPAGARFCLACGTRLAAEEAVPRELRKMVTVVFSDVVSSTALGERLDPESFRRVMGRYFDEMSAPILSSGGTLLRYSGDGILAIFGAPIEQADHADRALEAVREMAGPRLEALNEWARGEGLGDGFAIILGTLLALHYCSGRSVDREIMQFVIFIPFLIIDKKSAASVANTFLKANKLK